MLRLGRFGQQVSEHVGELPLRLQDMFAAVHKRREFGTVFPAVVADERGGLQRRFQS